MSINIKAPNQVEKIKILKHLLYKQYEIFCMDHPGIKMSYKNWEATQYHLNKHARELASLESLQKLEGTMLKIVN